MAAENPVDAKFAEATANLISTFIEYGNDELFSAFSERLLSHVESEAEMRRGAKRLIRSMAKTFNVKEGQKRRRRSSPRDNPPTDPVVEEKVPEPVIEKSEKKENGLVLVSAFGAARATKAFIIDEMLLVGRYTVEEIAKEADAAKETVTRRIRRLRGFGNVIEKTEDGRVGAAPSKKNE
jgi:hypothetical protein